jgi:D-glycero-D-manno-heptose 1,7-bisphosphate phosphatase
MTKNKAVFLDRDGVINYAIIKNGKPFSPNTLKEFVLVKDVKKSLDFLINHGFMLIIVTNQPNVARGLTTKDSQEEINNYIHSLLDITDIFACYHDDIDICECRKPKPGLIINAIEKYDIDLKRSFLIGDRWKDIEAAKSIGCRSIFLDNSYQEKQPKLYTYTTKNLADAVKLIINEDKINEN